MLEFCAQELCRLDDAGRLKLGAGVLRDFARHTDGDVVLYCLPEGAIGVYPPDTWDTMRNQASPSVEGPATSLVTRRTMRRFGALSQSGSISNQGRITVPPMFREYAGLVTGEQALIVGCEIGVELWNQSRFEEELATIHQHVRDKGQQEMSADLRGGE